MRRLRQVLLSSFVLFLVIPGAIPLLAKDGHLKLHVTPKEAYVFIDGVPLGFGDGTFWADPGEHSISVYNYGYKPYSTKFTSESGKTTSLSVALEAVPGTVSGPWGMIELKGSRDAAILVNGKVPDFFVGDEDEFNFNFGPWHQELLVPPGNYDLTALDYGGGEIYTGPVTVAENQKVTLFLNKSGEKRTSDWPRGKTLTAPLPRFKAGTASATVAVAKPSAQLTSNPGQVDCGGSAQLKWSSSDAPRVEIAGVGEVAASGKQTIQPKQTTAYKLTATGPGGVANSDATITVNSNVQSTLSVTPAEIRYHKVGDKVEQQGSAEVSWSAPGAETASLDPFGSVAPTGSRTVQPTPSKTGVGPVDETMTYTFHASNACGGSDTKTASLHLVGSIEAGGPAVELAPGNSVYFATAIPTERKPERGLVMSQDKVLDELVANLKQFLQISPDAHLVIEGHADRRGGFKYNMALSQRRADIVQSYLVSQGISAANLQTKAFGKEQQLDAETVKQLAGQDSNLTDQDRKKILRRLPIYVLANNRRVDIVVSTTGKKSLEYYPYNAPDVKALLAGSPHYGGAPKEKTTEEKK